MKTVETSKDIMPVEEFKAKTTCWLNRIGGPSRVGTLSSGRVAGYALLLAATAVLTGYFPPETSSGLPFYGNVAVMTPDLQITTLDDLIGERKTLVFYFLPTCPHCIEAGPVISRLAKKYSSQLQFIGVSPGSRPLSQLVEFKQRFELEFPIVQDSGAIFGKRNGLKGTPAYLLTEGSGSTTTSYSAYYPETETILEIAIVRFLGQDAVKLLDPDQYLGSRACSTCHREAYLSWSLTSHAVAFDALIAHDRIEDPKCLRCHVVGFKQKQGYKDLERSSHLAQVGCESCHGKAGGHNSSGTTARASYEAICVGCHDSEHSLGFNYAAARPHAMHQANRDITYDAWRARRASLLKGEKDRPLLQMPAGKLQGAKACAGCHEAEYQGWLVSRHAKALESLEKEGNESRPSCVRCHGTRRLDAPEADLDAYRAGVQCESCHGSGEAHVKAKGGKTNIVTLGNLSLECIIEPLCGSCHDEENDPDFNVKTASDEIRKAHRAASH